MALWLLVLINLFNYIDRNILAAVEPYVRADFFPDEFNAATGKMEEPEVAKTLMGALNAAFLISFMVLAPVFGALALKMSRWLLIAVGVVVWSLASGASGAAELFGQQLGGHIVPLFGYALPMAYIVMLLTRVFVGVGEAAYGPVAPDIIADMFPVERRGQVMAWFYTAIPLGGAIGYALGEIIYKWRGHWRDSFYSVVLPGIALGVWCLFMKEPKKETKGPARAPAWGDYADLFRVPSYTLNTVGMTFMVFAMGGLAFWAPAFLKFKGAQPMFGIPPATFFGLTTAVLGIISTILGGMAGDALRHRFSGAYFIVSGLAMLLAAPLLIAVVYLDFPNAWLPLAGFVFCLFFNTGPTNTILANVVRSDLRARGFAINIFIIHLLGDVASPPLMGAITGKDNRWDLSFLLVSAVVFVGGIAWLCGSAFLKADTERASGGDTPLPATPTATTHPEGVRPVEEGIRNPPR
jgi:MFS family permease